MYDTGATMDENQTGQELTPAAELLINDLETLKVVAEPLRMQLLELMLHQPRTAKQLAAALKVPQTKLYYHINLLETSGLIRLVGTRMVSGIVEKHYRAVAMSFRLNEDLLSLHGDQAGETLSATIGAVFESARADIMRSLQHKLIDPSQDDVRRKIVIGRKLARLSDAQLALFYERVEELFAAFDREEAAPDVPAYGLTIACYPIAPEEVRSSGRR